MIRRCLFTLLLAFPLLGFCQNNYPSTNKQNPDSFGKLFLRSFGLSIAANYDVFSTEFKTSLLTDMGYKFETGYKTANMMLDIQLNTPIGVFRQKWSETSFKGINGENLNYNIVRESGMSAFKHKVFQYSPNGLRSGLRLMFNYKDVKNQGLTPQSMITDMLLPDFYREKLNGTNLSFSKTEVFGLYGMVGYSNVLFSNINSSNQKLEGQLTKLYLISLTNVLRRSWIEYMLYVNTMVAKQNGKTHKEFLYSMNEWYRPFWKRFIPLPMLDFYKLKESIKITDLNSNSVLFESNPKGLWGYNVGVGWFNYIAIPKLRTVIVPSVYYYFLDNAGILESANEDNTNPNNDPTNMIQQKRFFLSLKLQTFF